MKRYPYLCTLEMGVLVGWCSVALGCTPVVRPSHCDDWAASSPAQMPATPMHLQPNFHPTSPHAAVAQWVQLCFAALHVSQRFLSTPCLSPISCFLKGALKPYRT